MKLGFNKTGEFRIAVSEGREYFYDSLLREMDAALEISPCSAIRVIIGSETLCGQLGRDHDECVPPIEIRL